MLQSTDVLNWNSIGKIHAAGNSNTTSHYTFTHNQAFQNNKVNFYRIKQSDLDDAFTYSKTISLKATGISPVVTAYPNPTKGYLHLTLAADQELRLIDIKGSVVWKNKLTSGSHTLSTAAFPKGTYLLLSEFSSQQIIIQ